MVAPFLLSISDIHAREDLLRRRRFGVIEMREGKLARIKLRPWPKLVSGWEARRMGQRFHARTTGDRCWLYYNQPWSASNYLSLQYLVSSGGCSLASFRGALVTLDWIAKLKNSAAIVCQPGEQFTERLAQRWGWERHLLDYPGRHLIKRFYGDFSAVRSIDRYLLRT